MKNYGKIEDPKDVTTKEYVDTIGAKEWTLVEDIVLEEAASAIQVSYERLQYKELIVEGKIEFTDTTITSQKVMWQAQGRTYFQSNLSAKATGSARVYLHVFLSPSGRVVVDGTISAYAYTLSGVSAQTGYHIDGMYGNETVCSENMSFWRLATTDANPMAAGSKLKVWGR